MILFFLCLGKVYGGLDIFNSPFLNQMPIPNWRVQYIASFSFFDITSVQVKDNLPIEWYWENLSWLGRKGIVLSLLTQLSSVLVFTHECGDYVDTGLRWDENMTNSQSLFHVFTFYLYRFVRILYSPYKIFNDLLEIIEYYSLIP